MEEVSTPAPQPALLPPGTRVGRWRVVARAGRGSHGAVYRAVPAEAEHAPPVALKLALFPADPRFERERVLLSGLNHPSIPRLLDHGTWQSPAGSRHPFLALEWVDGLSLYDWARQHPPSSRQVLGLLAQLARALQSLHAQGALHRDVKGDNVLVRREDGRALLTDFGSGIHPGADTLTPPSLFPGTPAYRAPESWLFSLQFHRQPSARYRPAPADDLYALGVTACRLVCGEYPELADPTRDEHGTWHLGAVLAPPALLNHPGVEPRLRALILHMLSPHPEQRGTAAELAEALEHAATPPAPKRARPSPATPPASERPAWPWLALAPVGLVALAAWATWAPSARPVQQPPVAQARVAEPGELDAGTAGLGEQAAATSLQEAPRPSPQEALASDAPPEPLPGQMRPDAKGRCPLKGQLALNGGCWVKTTLDREECAALLSGALYRGTCYVPVIPPGRHPTSDTGKQQ